MPVRRARKPDPVQERLLNQLPFWAQFEIGYRQDTLDGDAVSCTSLSAAIEFLRERVKALEAMR